MLDLNLPSDQSDRIGLDDDLRCVALRRIDEKRWGIMLDLIIRGGQVVTSEGVAQRDLGVQGEQISAVALPGTLDVEAGRTIDARGKVVLPGGIGC